MGFRPLNGVLFYLRFEKVSQSFRLRCFRPLNGVLFYLQNNLTGIVGTV